MGVIPVTTHISVYRSSCDVKCDVHSNKLKFDGEFNLTVLAQFMHVYICQGWFPRLSPLYLHTGNWR